MRCRACDAIMKLEEIIWRFELETHEDLCRTCRYTTQSDITNSINLTYTQDSYEEGEGGLEVDEYEDP